MAATLSTLFNAFDPNRPAGSRSYVDCSHVRGQDPFANTVSVELELQAGSASPGGTGHRRFLFTGHSGCGKSTELRQLVSHLNDRPIGGRRYVPIYVNVSELLALQDVEASDLLLAVLTVLADTLRQQHQINLREGYFASRWRELTSTLMAGVKLEKTTFGAGGDFLSAKADFGLIFRDDDARRRVREALQGRKLTIFNAVSEAIEAAKQELGERYPNVDFVFIIDDLEKIQEFGRSRGRTAQRKLFFDEADALRSPAAHVVYAVPLDLARADGPRLADLYGTSLHVLPMVKVFHRGDHERPYQPGYDKLREIVARRVGGTSEIDNVIESDALDLLIKYSGGHIRRLVGFMQQVAVRLRMTRQELPVRLEAARHVASAGAASLTLPFRPRTGPSSPR
jgi:hypothetical protein